MNVEFDISQKYMTFTVGDERGVERIGLAPRNKYRCLSIYDENEGVDILLTSEQAKILVDVINEKLKEDEKKEEKARLKTPK